MQGDKGWDRERGWGEGEYRPARPLLAGRSVFWEGGVSKLRVGRREGRRGNRSQGSSVRTTLVCAPNTRVIVRCFVSFVSRLFFDVSFQLLDERVICSFRLKLLDESVICSFRLKLLDESVICSFRLKLLVQRVISDTSRLSSFARLN